MTTPKESFDKGWSYNEGFAFALDGPEQAAFYSPSPLAESFGNPLGFGMYPGPPENYIGIAWDGSTWQRAFYQSSDLGAAQFGTFFEPRESFESEWRSNEGFQTAFGGGDLEAASFGSASGPQAVEDFESFYAERTFTANVGAVPQYLETDSAHGLSAGYEFGVRNEGGELPRPLTTRREFEVATVLSATRIQICEIGLGALTLLDVGTGTHYLWADADKYWHSALML